MQVLDVSYQAPLPINKREAVIGDYKIAKRYISITNKDIAAIFYSRKPLLYYNVDATMGAYTGKEVCESIGILCCHSLVNTLTR